MFVLRKHSAEINANGSVLHYSCKYYAPSLGRLNLSQKMIDYSYMKLLKSKNLPESVCLQNCCSFDVVGWFYFINPSFLFPFLSGSLLI